MENTNVYERALKHYDSGVFLQLEGSSGRYFVSTFIDSGILKMLDEEGNTVVDGYGRKITLKKAVIDHDRINELWETDFEFMEEIEEVA
jgi:hypothetical protein